MAKPPPVHAFIKLSKYIPDGIVKPDTLEKPVKVVYLGIGSNIGNRIIFIERAKSLLIANNMQLISSSSYYETPSWPNPKNPKFLNIVLKAFAHKIQSNY